MIEMTAIQHFYITTKQANITDLTGSILFLSNLLILLIEFLLHLPSKFNVLLFPPLYLSFYFHLFLSWLKQIIKLLSSLILQLNRIRNRLYNWFFLHLPFRMGILVVERFNPSDDVNHFPSRYFFKSINYFISFLRKVLKHLYHLFHDNLRKYFSLGQIVNLLQKFKDQLSRNLCLCQEIANTECSKGIFIFFD